MQQINKKPYLKQLRHEVKRLQTIIDSEPDDIVIEQAWAALLNINDLLSELAPDSRRVLG